MTLLLLISFLAVTPTPPSPTLDNLIPWAFGFLATLVSGFSYYIMYQQGKKLDDIAIQQKEMKEALFLTNKVRLLQLAIDASHPIIKEQVQTAIRETEIALNKK